MKFQNTKVLRNAYQNYKMSWMCELYDCYNSFSRAKVNAMAYCENLMHELNGHGLRIVSYNQNVFTVGFIFPTEDGGNAFAYITRDYDRYMKL